MYIGPKYCANSVTGYSGYRLNNVHDRNVFEIYLRGLRYLIKILENFLHSAEMLYLLYAPFVQINMLFVSSLLFGIYIAKERNPLDRSLYKVGFRY